MNISRLQKKRPGPGTARAWLAWRRNIWIRISFVDSGPPLRAAWIMIRVRSYKNECRFLFRIASRFDKNKMRRDRVVFRNAACSLTCGHPPL